MVGGYLTHNPLRSGFVRALRKHRTATETHAIASRRHAIAAAIAAFRTAEIDASERVVEESLRDHLALAEELKQVARLEITRVAAGRLGHRQRLPGRRPTVHLPAVPQLGPRPASKESFMTRRRVAALYGTALLGLTTCLASCGGQDGDGPFPPVRCFAERPAPLALVVGARSNVPETRFPTSRVRCCASRRSPARRSR